MTNPSIPNASIPDPAPIALQTQTEATPNSSPALSKKSPAAQNNSTPKDHIFTLVFFLVALCFLYWIQPFHFDLGIALFTIGYLLATGMYAFFSGIKQGKVALCYLTLTLLSALFFVLFDTSLKFFMFLFLAAIAVYWVSVFTKSRIAEQAGAQEHALNFFFWDLCNQLLLVPAANFFCWLQNSKQLFYGRKNTHALLQIALGILLCVPLSAFVVLLLSSADPAFSYILQKISNVFRDTVWTFFLNCILAIPIACYLYGLVFGNLRGNTAFITVSYIKNIRMAFQFLPPLTIYAALTMLDIIYILFFTSQSIYFISAFQSVLPAPFTYAEYARLGFFQLCLVAGINFSVVGLAHLLINKQNKRKILSFHTILLSLFTLLLIVTALRKMGMYIETYGFTQLRIYTTWFMVLLFLLFLLLIFRQVWKFSAAPVAFSIFTICFFALCYGNVDGQIAKYNISRFEQGTLSSFSVRDYKALSAAAIPYLAELYQKLPEDGQLQNGKLLDGSAAKGTLYSMEAVERQQLKEELYTLITKDSKQYPNSTKYSYSFWYDGNFLHFNNQAFQAQIIVNQLLME